MGIDIAEPGLRSDKQRFEAVEVTLQASDIELVTKLVNILAGDDLESERLRDLIQEVLTRPDGCASAEPQQEDERLH